MKQQKGFTLIELIMVIVVLGILSAFALPRFADFSGDAETAAIEGALGSVKSSSAIAHASCLADASCSTTAASGNSVVFEGETITMAFGYPTADSAGISVAANLDGFSLATSTDVGNGRAGAIITRNTIADDSDCAFYASATSSAAPVSGTGLVSGAPTNATCN